MGWERLGGPARAMTLERVGPEAFDGERLRRPGTVVVGFLADWCPVCRAFLPEFEQLAKGGRRLLMADVTEEESPLWDRFRVEIVPTVLVFRDGETIFRADGERGTGLDRGDLRRIEKAADGAGRSGGSAPSGPRRRR